MINETTFERQQININDYKPVPTLYKRLFKAHGIKIGTIANYLGMSYPYVCNMLNGSYRMTKETELKLQKLIDQLGEV